MLLNLSNHPSATWSPEQLGAAQRDYGQVLDMPFPAVPPQADLDEVRLLSEKTYAAVRRLAAQHPTLTVHLMGEMTLVYQLLDMLRNSGIPCVASTSERIVREEADGRKVSQFRFVRFRPYF